MAQTNAGRLIGTVSGPDGVLPGATVIVKDNATERERTVTTNDVGGFSVPQLEFGNYTVTITAKGFKTFVANDLKIDAGREYSLTPVLEVGNISENVTVTAGADILNTTTAELSSTVSPQQIKELPLNGRNPLNLIGLQAGVSGRNGISINGTRTSSVNFTRDGINVQDNFIRNGFVSDAPTVDDTGEFTVVTQNAGAESGYGTAQVQLVTPRGGSEFHGSLYEFNRNSKFTANDFFSNRDGIENPFLNLNEFGGSFSGPLPLPKVGEGCPSLIKGKTFFFGSYGGFRLAQSALKSTTILRPDARTGNFTYRRSDNSQLQTVNVLTGAGLTGAIPTSAGGSIAGVDPTIQSRILDSVPTVGNRTDIGDGLNTTGLSFNQSDPETRDNYTIRIDTEINEKNSVYGVYRYNTITDARTDIDTSFNVNPVASQGGPGKFLALAWRINPTANFTNEIRGGGQTDLAPFTNNGLPEDPFLIGTNANTGVIVGGLITSPELNFRDQGRDTRLINFQDNASLIKGNHAIRFGGDTQLYKVRSFNQARTGIPTYNISNINNPSTPRLDASLFPGGISTAQRGVADSLRYLLGGIVGSGAVDANVTSRDSGFIPGAQLDRNLKYETISFYGGDQWRITPQLTLNYGLRYELYTPLRSTDGLYLEPVFTGDSAQTVLNQNGTFDFVGVNSGKGSSFFKLDKNNFAPNISIAYAPKPGN
ncbi:MAG: carboxypeptidase regulatory-like domain-containing protein, partial [Pyrinomonadaceae bacterium]